MAISDLVFSSWPLSKQYLAAHYYLSEEKPISITEAQRAQLGSLHLFVSFGAYSEGQTAGDLNKCTLSEKRKRIEEWKSLGNISRSSAMRKFIDMLNSLFPNWTRYRKLHYEFEIEWLNMQKLSAPGKSPLDVHSREMYSTRKSVSRSFSPMQLSLRRPHQTVKDSVPNAVKAVSHFQKSRILPYLPRVPKLNAAYDAKETFYALQRDYQPKAIHNINGESIYYRLPHSHNEKSKKRSDSNFFDSFIEELANKPTKSIIPEKKSATTLEDFPELNLMKTIHQKVFSMNAKLEEIENSYM